MNASAAVGAYIRDLRRIVPMTKAEEAELRPRIARGDLRARDRLAEGNLPLALSLAIQHSRHTHHEYLSDLAQEASLALLLCARRFDPAYPWPFHLQARIKIGAALFMARLLLCNVIRLPRRQLEIRAALAAARWDLSQALKREPTQAEIAAAIGLTEPQLVYTLLRFPVRVEPVEDRPEDAEETAPAESVVLEDSRPTPEGTLLLAEAGEQSQAELERLRAGVAALPTQEREVVVLRFGEGLKLSETAKRIRRSEARVTQLQRAGLDSLRAEVGRAL